jgi:hypothetical protein
LGEECRRWRLQGRSRVGRRLPRPAPPSPFGRPHSPEALRQQFRWLLMYFLQGKTWRAIGHQDGNYYPASVRSGVYSFVQLLPDSWTKVFRTGSIGRSLNEWLPIKHLRAVTAAWAP